MVLKKVEYVKHLNLLEKNHRKLGYTYLMKTKHYIFHHTNAPLHEVKYEAANMRYINLDKIKKLILCSGKVFYDLVEKREALNAENLAIIRIEQLYSFPYDNQSVVLSFSEDEKIKYKDPHCSVSIPRQIHRGHNCD